MLVAVETIHWSLKKHEKNTRHESDLNLRDSAVVSLIS